MEETWGGHSEHVPPEAPKHHPKTANRREGECEGEGPIETAGTAPSQTDPNPIPPSSVK